MPRSPRPRRRHLAAVPLATALALAGCGVSVGDDASVSTGTSSGPGGGGGGQVVEKPSSFEGTGGAVYLSKAAEATGEVTTQKMSMTQEITGMPMIGDVSFTAEGAFDNESGQGRMTMDMGELYASMGDLGGESGLPEDAGIMEMVIDGDTVYIKSPLFSSLGGEEGKPWMKTDVGELSSSGGIAGGSAGTDPAAFLDFFEAVGDDVTEVGTEEVRGVETTHLTATIDAERLVAEADPEEAAELEEQLESLGAAGEAFTSIPAEVWIDEDGYVRKFTMTFDLSEAVAEGGSDAEDPMFDMGDVTISQTIELYDFNEPVDIEIPDPSKVSELDPSTLGGN